MSVTGSIITAICESLLNSSGRFRTLKRVSPSLDRTGQPRFTVRSFTADFETFIEEHPFTLKVPLGPGTEKIGTAAGEVPPFSPERTPFIAPWRFHRKEMLLFMGEDAAAKSDVITEVIPDGLPLRNFIRTNLNSAGLSSIREILSALSDLYSSMEASETVHGHIRAENIIVANGNITLTGYLHAHTRTATHDREALLTLSILSYIAACEPPLFPYLWKPLPPDKPNLLLSYLRLQAQFDRNERLLEAVEALQRPESQDSLHIGKLLLGIASAPFHPMPLLKGLLEGASDTPSIELARDLSVNYTTGEDRTLNTDLSKCDHTTLSENMVRYCSGNKWGFADQCGRNISSNDFCTASDFYEGRAAVSTPQGFGLLGKDGGYIMKPVYEALEWYGPDNIASACRDGLWNLYDRCGRQLTLHGYEWMAEPSEGMLVVKRGGKFGFITVDGTPMTQLRFDEAFSFRDGSALVEAEGELFHIDRQGKKIH